MKQPSSSLPRFLAAAALSAVLIGGAPLRLDGQSSPSFEVVSIKPNASDDTGSRVLAQPDGRFVMTNAPVSAIVLVAYELADYTQVNGLPEWTRKERVDIEAQAPAGVPIAFPGQGTALPRMLQAALAERMKLSTHVEKRAVPMLALVKAREDGRLGPNLTPSSIDCSTAPSGPPADSAPATPGGAPRCGARLSPTSFTAQGIPLDRLIRLIIAPRVGRIVVDRTGLSGTFDVSLRYRGPEPARGTAAADPSAAGSDPDLPSIETAVQEQLGLRLRSISEEADVLVVDHIERPTRN